MVQRIAIAGAGSIGCFVGGLLRLGGADTRLLARARIVDELTTNDLHLTSFEGWEERLASTEVGVTTVPAEALAQADLVLVTVKSGGTTEVGRLIEAHAPASARVVSLQNGLFNADLLRTALPDRPVFAGMVSFNVLHQGAGRFHRGTSGPVVVEDGAPALRAPHLDFLDHPDMAAVLAGKLLYNLNNALNALSGLTLAEQLSNRDWRRLFATAQEEALAVFRAEGVEPWSMSNLPVGRMPFILRLPNFLFRQIAKRGVRIDRTARSSMWEDLERCRPTEIDELQGAIIRKGEQLGIATPVNRAIAEAIRAAEEARQGSPRLSPDALKLATS